MNVDISLPRVNAHEPAALHREWRRQAGDKVPVPASIRPPRGAGSFRLRIRVKTMADLVVQDVRSDALSGSCEWQERVKIVFQIQGQAKLTVARQRLMVVPGLVSASGDEMGWEVGDGARGVVLLVPAREVRFPKNRPSLIVEQNVPARR